jgi:hypothetical protein
MAGLGYSGREQWDPAFTICSGILLLGACGWLLIDLSKDMYC